MDPTTSLLRNLDAFESCFQQISTSNSVPQGEVVQLIQAAGISFEEEIMRMQYLQQRGIRIINELAKKTILLVSPKPLSPLAKSLVIPEMGPIPSPNWTVFNIDNEKMETTGRSLNQLQTSIVCHTELLPYYKDLKKYFDSLSSFVPNPNGENLISRSLNNEFNLFCGTVMQTGQSIKTLRSATEICAINRIPDQMQYQNELSQFIIRTPKIPLELAPLLLARLSKCEIAFQDDMCLEIAKKVTDTCTSISSSFTTLLTDDQLNRILSICDGIQDAIKHKSIMERISKDIFGLHQLNIILTRLNKYGISSDGIQENVIKKMLGSHSIKEILPFIETIQDEKRRQPIVSSLLEDPPPTLQGNGLDKFDIEHLLNHFDKYQYDSNFQDEMCSLMAKEFADCPDPVDLFYSLVDRIMDVEKRKDPILSARNYFNSGATVQEISGFLVYLNKYDPEFRAKCGIGPRTCNR
jgi:hypothetical protein